jgi:hypothetical protein
MAPAPLVALLVIAFLPQQIRPGNPNQAQEDRYNQVPLQGDIEAILRQLLLRADEEADLAKLLDELRRNPQMHKLDADLLKKFDAENPLLRRLVLDFARNHKDGKLDPELVEKLRGDFLKLEQAFRQDWENLQIRGRRGRPSLEMPKGNLDIQHPVQVPADVEARLAEWAKDLLREVDRSQAGEFLRDSPAWRNALRDFERLVRMPDGQFKWLGRLPEGWNLPQGWTPRLGDWSSWMPNLPRLPRWRLSPPNLGNWNPNFGGAPGIGAPTIGGGRVNENIVWVLLPLLFVLLAWVFYQKLGRNPAALARSVLRGPWPVNPALVTTRSQLIQAFDYLALLLLGEEVRTWNHLAVARKLGEQAARNPAAADLAKLYELARYTPGDDILSLDARNEARRHLVALAGSGRA